MFVIGLTGGIASGKSTAARLIEARGARLLDADLLGHEVYEPGRPAWLSLQRAFGAGILTADSAIDRAMLGAIVFADQSAMRRLTDIVWPEMKLEMKRRLAQCREAGDRVVVIEAAVLLEASWDDLVDEIWVVSVPERLAVERLQARNGLTEAAARARLEAQMTNDQRTARADVVIDNGGSIEELECRVDALWQKVLERAA